MSRPSLVIIGAGWGGFPISQQINLDRYSVKVISPIRTIQYTPLLASAACGLFDFRMAEEPVRRRHRAGMEYYKAGAESIDLHRRVVVCRPDVGHMTVEGNKTFEVGYDVLVLAMGCGTQTFGTPGAQEHALFLRTTNDARILQQRILQMLDAASLPGVTEQQQRDLCHIRVVGGGAVGIEAVAELFDLYDEGLRFVYPHLDGKVSFTIHDVADSVLSTFDEGLGQYAMQSLRAKKVEVKTSNHIEKVEQDAIHTKEDGRLPYGLLLWATGNSASPLTEALDVKKSKGVPRILTDKHLRVLKTDGTAYDNVFALGDAADIESQSLPMLAEVALQKGEYLTHRLNAQPPTTTEISHVQPFEYKQRAILAYLGQRDGIVGGRSEWKGNSAWLAWRSGSLGWTRSWRRKIAILAQWGLIWWNGRDIARL
jgi:NADH:ubiquinone reductase (non-electrogenic)